MSVPLYMDHHIPDAITDALRRRGVDVLTAREDGLARERDNILLDRATALGGVIFTFDRDFLVEAANRQVAGTPFAGVVYARALKVSIGQCIDDLQTIAEVAEPSDLANRVEYLPL